MKEGKVFKRILAVALVVVMTITMVPFGVFATGEAPACTHESYTKVPASAATCTEPALQEHYECNNCHAKGKLVTGGVFSVRTIVQLTTAPAAEHNWNAGTVTTPATCGAKGTKTFTCSVCNGTKTEEIAKLTTHSWNATTGKCTVCSADCTHSWTAGKCTVCEKVCTHTGGTATCKAQAICDVCGQSYGAKANHTYATAFTEDKAPTCTVAGSKSKHCTTTGCDAKTDVTPIPATGHKYDKNKADGDCTECTHICTHNENPSVAIPEVKATCTTDGSKNGFKCADCGKVVIEPKKVEKLGHDIEVIEGTAPTCTTAGKSDGQRCKRCDYKVEQVNLPALDHKWSTTKEIVKDSTCTAKGSKAIVCTREGCNAIKEGTTEEIAMKPHDYKAKDVTKKATCETAGEKAKVCKNCTAKTEIEVIKALGHDWDKGTVKVAADCQKKGTTTFKCQRTDCGKTEDRATDKLDCQFEEKIKEPTCEEDGYSTFTCKMCKSSYIDKKVDKFGHSFITYVQDENTATCYSNGTKTALCDHGCGKKNTITDEGSMIDHKLTDFKTIKEATCTEEGEEEAKCFYFDKCGYSESYPTDALGHTITKDTKFTVDKAATCTEKGSQSKHCERCSYTEGAEEIPALGHDFQLQEGSSASCLTAGVANYKCSRCPETKKETVADPLGHDFNNYVFNEGTATCQKDGTETSKCSRCDETDTRTAAGSKLDHVAGEAAILPATTKVNGLSRTTCTVCGEVVEEFEIAQIASLKLAYTSAIYNGKQRIPKLTITDANGNALIKGTDYTVVTPTKEESAKIGTHSYTVTFIGNYEGEEEVTYKVVPAKTSKISATKKQTEIKLTWKAVDGAVGYRVYVLNTQTGKYKTLVKYVKGKTTYTVKDLKAGTNYKFAVKAYGKDGDTVVWADTYTEASFTTLVAKTSKITATPAKTSVKLSWKAVSGADGYRVYVYNTKTKKYSTVATVKGKTTYTVKDLKAGTSYTFAVKAYDTVAKNTVWSNQYTTVKVTTKK